MGHQAVMDTREDRLTGGQLLATLYTGPTTNFVLTAEFGNNDSSISEEAYDLIGGSIVFSWAPNDNWLTTATAAYQRVSYDTVQHLPKRKDDIWLSGFKISRLFNKVEMFLQVDYLENGSSLEREDYRRVVSQCGVAYYF